MFVVFRLFMPLNAFLLNLYKEVTFTNYILDGCFIVAGTDSYDALIKELYHALNNTT